MGKLAGIDDSDVFLFPVAIFALIRKQFIKTRGDTKTLDLTKAIHSVTGIFLCEDRSQRERERE